MAIISSAFTVGIPIPFIVIRSITVVSYLVVNPAIMSAGLTTYDEHLGSEFIDVVKAYAGERHHQHLPDLSGGGIGDGIGISNLVGEDKDVEDEGGDGGERVEGASSVAEGGGFADVVEAREHPNALLHLFQPNEKSLSVPSLSTYGELLFSNSDK